MPRVTALAPPLLAAASVAILLAALGYQFIGGLEPCILCIWQRWPHAVTAVLALGAWAAAPQSALRVGLLGLVTVSMAVSVGLAGYHVGVEQHWWAGTEECGLAPLGGADIDTLRQQLLATPVARCDEVLWSLFGISMAGYNTLLSVGLGLLAALAMAQTLRLRRP